MIPADQIVSGSLCQMNVEQKEIYGFVFLKKNVNGDGFIVDTYMAPGWAGIKSELNGKIVTCVGKFPVTFSGTTGSKDIFLYNNHLIAALNKDSMKFCSVI